MLEPLLPKDLTEKDAAFSNHSIFRLDTHVP